MFSVFEDVISTQGHKPRVLKLTDQKIITHQLLAQGPETS